MNGAASNPACSRSPAQLDQISVDDSYSLSLYRDDWHQGVIGIRLAHQDRHHRPAIVFAPGNDGELKGSGRSISAPHLRDALTWLPNATHS